MTAVPAGTTSGSLFCFDFLQFPTCSCFAAAFLGGLGSCALESELSESLLAVLVLLASALLSAAGLLVHPAQ